MKLRQAKKLLVLAMTPHRRRPRLGRMLKATRTLGRYLRKPERKLRIRLPYRRAVNAFGELVRERRR